MRNPLEFCCLRIMKTWANTRRWCKTRYSHPGPFRFKFTFVHESLNRIKFSQPTQKNTDAPFPINMEVENGGLEDDFSLQGGHFPLPWLWEEGYSNLLPGNFRDRKSWLSTLSRNLRAEVNRGAVVWDACSLLVLKCKGDSVGEWSIR